MADEGRDDEVPQSDWTRRAERARAEGGWFAPTEPEPLPRRARWTRFAVGFGAAMLLNLVVRAVLDLARGRPLSVGAVAWSALGGVFAALVIGCLCAFPPRGHRRRL